MVFNVRSIGGGKSEHQAQLLDVALARGHRVAVVQRSGTLIYQRHGPLTSITPLQDEPATFARYQLDDDTDDLPPVPRAA